MSYKCTLSPELLEKAKKELNEDPDNRTEAITALREELLKFPGLNPKYDDAFLLQFLRARKFNKTRAHTQVINYYNAKKDNEDIYATMTPKSVQHMLQEGLIRILPNKAKNGETIIMFKPGKWDPDKYPIMDIYKTMFIVLSHIIQSEDAQVNGILLINDLGDMTWNHAKNFSPTLAKKISNLLQDVMPMRLKGVHYVHEPTFFDLIFRIMKQFMREKMASRIHLHGESVSELGEYVDIKHLPAEYGGEETDQDTGELMTTLLSKESEFEANKKYGFVSMVMEKESEKTSNAGGMAGTFKKLSVD